MNATLFRFLARFNKPWARRRLIGELLPQVLREAAAVHPDPASALALRRAAGHCEEWPTISEAATARAVATRVSWSPALIHDPDAHAAARRAVNVAKHVLAGDVEVALQEASREP